MFRTSACAGQTELETFYQSINNNMNRTARQRRKRPQELTRQKTKAAFQHLFGSHSSMLLIGMSCLSLVALSWFGDGLWEFISIIGGKIISSQVLDKQWLSIMGKVSPFLIISAGWWLLIRNSMESVANLTVHEQLGPLGCKVLIIFLSPPYKDKEIIEQLLNNTKAPLADAVIKDIKFRESFIGPWRMPIEAIAWHLQQGTLERVIVAPSATVKTVTETRQGTFSEFQTFKKLIEKITGTVSVHHAGEAQPDKWMEGVDYESARALRNCLKDIFDFLLEIEQYSEEDILIDITAGQKLGSSIGTLLSLQAGRQIQYVSTNDYSVKSYNISYEETQ